MRKKVVRFATQCVIVIDREFHFDGVTHHYIESSTWLYHLTEVLFVNALECYLKLY